MQIVNYCSGKAVIFPSGIVITQYSSTNYYQFFVTNFKDYTPSKSALKTLMKDEYLTHKQCFNMADVLSYGLEYIKGCHQVKRSSFTKNQKTIFDMAVKFILPELKAEKVEKSSAIEVLQEVATSKNGVSF